MSWQKSVAVYTKTFACQQLDFIYSVKIKKKLSELAVNKKAKKSAWLNSQRLDS
jgi:hypothetical protein